MHIFIIVFLLNLLIDLSAQSFCLASYEDYEEHRRSGSYLPYKRLRIEQGELERSFLLLSNQWNMLLYELFVSCLDYLSFKELGTAQLVCKYWSSAAKDATLSVENHYFKRSYATLLRKIDNNQKVQEHVKEMISNYVVKGNLTWQFDTIPDFLHKSLLVPSAIAQILRTPQLMASLFTSDIKASQIYAALHQRFLDKKQRVAIESYGRLRPVRTWNKTIFSEDFLNYINLYKGQYKAYYLLALFQLSTGSPIYKLLDMVNHKLSNPRIYVARNEERALWLPQAMMYLEIPPIDSYKMSAFCYKESVNKLTALYRSLWERYQELFLHNAALGNIREAQFKLGAILYNKGNYEMAQFFYQQAASQAHTKAQYALGCLLLEQGRAQEAETFLYQAAIKKHLFARFVLAQLWFHQGHLEKAESVFRQVAEQANGKVLYDLAQLLKGNFHPQELDLFYRQIVSYAPFNQQHVLSTLLLSKNDLRQIDSYYRQVLNYGSTEVQQMLAEMLFDYGRPTLTEILLQEIKDQNNKIIKSLLNKD